MPNHSDHLGLLEKLSAFVGTKRVQAAIIEDIEMIGDALQTHRRVSLRMDGETPLSVLVPVEVFSRHEPVPGVDWLVLYPDGYISVSPGEAFKAYQPEAEHAEAFQSAVDKEVEARIGAFIMQAQHGAAADDRLFVGVDDGVKGLVSGAPIMGAIVSFTQAVLTPVAIGQPDAPLTRELRFETVVPPGAGDPPAGTTVVKLTSRVTWLPDEPSMRWMDRPGMAVLMTLHPLDMSKMSELVERQKEQHRLLMDAAAAGGIAGIPAEGHG